MATTGKVKWFNDKKGYGFITLDSGESDVFLHFSQLKQSGIDYVQEGDNVSFDTETNPKTNW